MQQSVIHVGRHIVWYKIHVSVLKLWT